MFARPRQDSNLRTRLRRPLLYPLSYGGSGRRKITSHPAPRRGRGRRPHTAIATRVAGMLVREVAVDALASRAWRRHWDACSWWTTMR